MKNIKFLGAMNFMVISKIFNEIFKFSLITCGAYVFDARVELNQKMTCFFHFHTHHQRSGNELDFGEEFVDYDSDLNHLQFVLEEHDLE